MIATMDYVGLVLESSCEINIFGYIKAQAFSTSDSCFFFNLGIIGSGLGLIDFSQD